MKGREKLAHLNENGRLILKCILNMVRKGDSDWYVL
jgi:hypothetical protein